MASDAPQQDSQRKHHRSTLDDEAEKSSKRHKHRHHHHRHRHHRSKKHEDESKHGGEDVAPPVLDYNTFQVDDDVEEGEILEEDNFETKKIASAEIQADDICGGVNSRNTIREYPKATAVLVRNHRVYIWGDSWISAKTQAECYHYLFEAAIKLHQLGLDWSTSTPSHGPIHVNRAWGCGMNFSRGSKTGSFSLDYMIEPSQRCILLNMEGTMIPRSFFSNMFLNEGKHLAAIHNTEETSQPAQTTGAFGFGNFGQTQADNFLFLYLLM